MPVNDISSSIFMFSSQCLFLCTINRPTMSHIPELNISIPICLSLSMLKQWIGYVLSLFIMSFILRSITPHQNMESNLTHWYDEQQQRRYNCIATARRSVRYKFVQIITLPKINDIEIIIERTANNFKLRVK